jgi:hypothetical protein
MCRYSAVALLASIMLIAASAQASGAHWCRQGDPPIYASARTSCPFAGNIVTDYVNVCHETRHCHMRVASPVTHRRYRIICDRTGPRYTGSVRCAGARGTGIWTRFSSEI